MAKSAEAVMSSLKVQLSYHGMRNETPEIDFLKGKGQKALPE